LEGSDVIPELEDVEEEAINSKEWVKLQAMRLRKVDRDMSQEEKQRLWNESGRGS
jgi:hypothetical protein